jgi:hypothetical protein
MKAVYSLPHRFGPRRPCSCTECGCKNITTVRIWAFYWDGRAPKIQRRTACDQCWAAHEQYVAEPKKHWDWKTKSYTMR